MTVNASADLTETPDPYGAFPPLTEEQVAALQTVGGRRSVRPGDVLYREGEGSDDFFVILEGKVAVFEDSSAGQHVIGVYGPRRFLGELGLLTGQTVFVTAVVAEAGEVLVVPAEQLRKIVTQDQVLGDLIPASTADATLGPDRARSRHPHHRLALLPGHAKAA